MAGGRSVYWADKLLGLFQGTNVTAPTVYAQLHVGDPGTAGTTSVSAGSTTRNAVTFSAPSSGSMAVSSVGAWTNGGTSETLTYITLWDAATSGNFLQSCALTSSQAWASGNTFTLTGLTITENTLAS